MDEKKIEQKLEEISAKVEAKMKDVGDLVDKKINEHFSGHKAEHFKRKAEHSTKFWGILLLVIGAIFLVQNLHWIDFDLPLIPILMILIGGYMIYGSKHD